MFKLKDEAKGWEGIAGVPWRDMTDEEYGAVSADYDAHYSDDQRGSLARWFEHVPDPARAPAKPKSAVTKEDQGNG